MQPDLSSVWVKGALPTVSLHPFPHDATGTRIDNILGYFHEITHACLSIKPIISSFRSLITHNGGCALCYAIQNSMEAILACHPALSTKWLDWVAKWCERWCMRTGPIDTTAMYRYTVRSCPCRAISRNIDFGSCIIEQFWTPPLYCVNHSWSSMIPLDADMIEQCTIAVL